MIGAKYALKIVRHVKQEKEKQYKHDKYYIRTMSEINNLIISTSKNGLRYLTIKIDEHRDNINLCIKNELSKLGYKAKIKVGPIDGSNWLDVEW